jgi:hypothetical protein
MIKEFQIEDILNAVNSISKIERNKTKINNTKSFTNNSKIIGSNEQAESKKSGVLVLDQMIE